MNVECHVCTYAAGNAGMNIKFVVGNFLLTPILKYIFL